MNSTIRILCTDGRLFEGRFHCIDSDGNIILTFAEWINGGYKGTERKNVGLCLFTKKWIKKVYFPNPIPTIDNNLDLQGVSEDDTQNNTNQNS